LLNNEANRKEIEKLDLNIYPSLIYDPIILLKNKTSCIEDIKKKEVKYIDAFSLSIIKSPIHVEFKSKKQSQSRFDKNFEIE
jgi:hypothetical protein